MMSKVFNEKENKNSKVGEFYIVLKFLYDKYVRDDYCSLEYGYEIEHTYQEETDIHYYDLRKTDGTIACKNGENCELFFEEDKNRYKLVNKNREIDIEFYLSKDELLVALFGFEQENLLETVS